MIKTVNTVIVNAHLKDEHEEWTHDEDEKIVVEHFGDYDSGRVKLTLPTGQNANAVFIVVGSGKDLIAAIQNAMNAGGY